MNKTRLEAFSDGVLAIIITIMVLELKVPHGENLADLRPLLPQFVPYEDAPAGQLPARLGELEFSAVDDHNVAIHLADRKLGEANRYWLARFLFRLPLHGFRLGYLETYGGFFYDDRGADIRFGVREKDNTVIARSEATRAVEVVYRAVAPPAYRERLE